MHEITLLGEEVIQNMMPLQKTQPKTTNTPTQNHHPPKKKTKKTPKPQQTNINPQYKKQQYAAFSENVEITEKHE